VREVNFDTFRPYCQVITPFRLIEFNITMDVVAAYANSGDYDLTPKICGFFEDLSPTGQTIAIPTADALAVVSHLLPALDKPECTTGWYILWALSCPRLNSNATDFLDALQDLACCDQILNLSWQLHRFATSGFATRIANWFIADFVYHSLSRQHMVIKYPDLIRDMITAVETATTLPAEKFGHQEGYLATHALAQVVQTIMPDPTSAADAIRYDFLDVLIRYNGFSAVSLALEYAVCNCDRIEHKPDGENRYLAVCALALQTLLLSLRDWQPAHLDRELYTLDRNARFRLNMTMYNMLTLRTAFKTHLMAYSVAFVYSNYISHTCGEDALREYLLFTLPREPHGEPLLAHLLARMQAFNKMGADGRVEAMLEKWASSSPALAEVINCYRLSEPDKSRCCAFPGCCYCDEGAVATMKKCGRCKAVYYCGAAHQQAHWPEHKRDCKVAEK
jgi:hypothetical protein